MHSYDYDASTSMEMPAKTSYSLLLLQALGKIACGPPAGPSTPVFIVPWTRLVLVPCYGSWARTKRLGTPVSLVDMI
jgi:hypothetical protein